LRKWSYKGKFQYENSKFQKKKNFNVKIPNSKLPQQLCELNVYKENEIVKKTLRSLRLKNTKQLEFGILKIWNLI